MIYLLKRVISRVYYGREANNLSDEASKALRRVKAQNKGLGTFKQTDNDRLSFQATQDEGGGEPIDMVYSPEVDSYVVVGIANFMEARSIPFSE
jgi:hypothetical protein